MSSPVARLLSRAAPAAVAVALGVGVYMFAKRGADRVPEHVKEAVSAGSAALERGQPRAAAASFEKGVDGLVAADSHPVLAAELLLHNADALESAGQLQDAADAFRRAEALCVEMKKRKDMPPAAIARLDIHGKHLVALARRAELEAQLGHGAAAKSALRSAQALLLETQRPLLQRAFSGIALPSAVCSRIAGGTSAFSSAAAASNGTAPSRAGGAGSTGSGAAAAAAARTSVAAQNALRDIAKADRRRLADAAGVFFNSAMQAAAEVEAAAAAAPDAVAAGHASRISSEAAGLSFLAFAFVWAALQGALAAAEKDASKSGSRRAGAAVAAGAADADADASADSLSSSSLWQLMLLPEGSPALSHEVAFPLGLPDKINSATAGAAVSGAAGSGGSSSLAGLGPITLSSCLSAAEMLSAIASAEAKLAAIPTERQPRADSEAGSLAALCGAAARLCTVALWQLHEDEAHSSSSSSSSAAAGP